MALEWIQDNIEAFGGDPEQVTIMGESAGASSVANHIVSPRSCKLFNKAIMQSSALRPRWGIVSKETALNRSGKEQNVQGVPNKPVKVFVLIDTFKMNECYN